MLSVSINRNLMARYTLQSTVKSLIFFLSMCVWGQGRCQTECMDSVLYIETLDSLYINFVKNALF